MKRVLLVAVLIPIVGFGVVLARRFERDYVDLQTQLAACKKRNPCLCPSGDLREGRAPRRR